MIPANTTPSRFATIGLEEPQEQQQLQQSRKRRTTKRLRRRRRRCRRKRPETTVLVALSAVAVAAFGGGKGIFFSSSSFFPATMTMMTEATASASASASKAAASAALGAFKSMDYRYFVAGGTCAAFSHGITTPIDVVKTKLQADPEKYEGKGLVGATLAVCRDAEGGGPSALLSGLGPTVLGYGIEGAMKFGAYEVTKPVFVALLGSKRKVLAYALASFLAGTIASVLLVPMESLRIKQVTDPTYKGETIATGLPRILREDGFASTMGGVWAMLTKQVPYTFGKQVSFDLVAGFLYSVVFVAATAAAATTTTTTAAAAVVREGKIFSLLSADRWKWIVSVLSAAMASVAACLCSQPGDMILTETYNPNRNHRQDGDEKPRKRGTRDPRSERSDGDGDDDGVAFGTVVRGVYGRGGIPEFYRGTRARLVHVGLIITSQLVVYDLVKQLLGLPATGSR